MEKQMLYSEYEEILLGNKDWFSAYFFKVSDDIARKNAMAVIDFAFRKYLRWTPDDVKKYMTKEIMEEMKLEKLMRYIIFPLEIDPDEERSFIANILYPKEIKTDPKELVLKVYKRVLSGELCKFPKEYLSGTTGMYKAGICFQYLLNQKCAFTSTAEMYEFFSKKEGAKLIKDYRLKPICKEIYLNPVDFLHESLPESQKDEFYYYYYRFKYYFNNIYCKDAKIKDRRIKGET